MGSRSPWAVIGAGGDSPQPPNFLLQGKGRAERSWAAQRIPPGGPGCWARQAWRGRPARSSSAALGADCGPQPCRGPPPHTGRPRSPQLAAPRPSPARARARETRSPPSAPPAAKPRPPPEPAASAQPTPPSASAREGEGEARRE